MRPIEQTCTRARAQPATERGRTKNFTELLDNRKVFARHEVFALACNSAVMFTNLFI